jgi:hypothetical protein
MDRLYLCGVNNWSSSMFKFEIPALCGQLARKVVNRLESQFGEIEFNSGKIAPDGPNG